MLSWMPKATVCDVGEQLWGTLPESIVQQHPDTATERMVCLKRHSAGGSTRGTTQLEDCKSYFDSPRYTDAKAEGPLTLWPS